MNKLEDKKEIAKKLYEVKSCLVRLEADGLIDEFSPIYRLIDETLDCILASFIKIEV